MSSYSVLNNIHSIEHPEQGSSGKMLIYYVQNPDEYSSEGFEPLNHSIIYKKKLSFRELLTDQYIYKLIATFYFCW